jgi:hypothetical protein
LALARGLDLAIGDGSLLAIAATDPAGNALYALFGRGKKGCTGRKAEGEDETVEDTLHAEWPDPGRRYGMSLAAEGWRVDFDEAMSLRSQRYRLGDWHDGAGSTLGGMAASSVPAA